MYHKPLHLGGSFLLFCFLWLGLNLPNGTMTPSRAVCQFPRLLCQSTTKWVAENNSNVLSQFRKPDVQNQGVHRAMLSLKTLTEGGYFVSPCNWRRHPLHVPGHHGTRLDTVLPGNSVLKASVRMGFSAVIWAAERGVMMVITH